MPFQAPNRPLHQTLNLEMSRAIHQVHPMSERRRVQLLRNGRNQAVQIPVEFELPASEAIMHRQGDRLVIEPARKRGLIALLKTMKPIEESLPYSTIPCRRRSDWSSPCSATASLT